jgi:hypothetical protein
VRSARESRASARWRAIGTQEPLPRVRAASDASVDDFERHGVTQDGVDGPVGDAHGAPVRQSFQFKLFGSKRLRHLHRAIDVSAEIWNHSVALKNRYYKLSMLMTSEFVF